MGLGVNTNQTSNIKNQHVGDALKVEYSLTDRGRDIIPLVNHIGDYGLRFMEATGAG